MRWAADGRRSEHLARVGPPHATRVTLLAATGIFILLGAFLVIAGIVNIGKNLVGGITLLFAAVVVFALAELLRRSARPVPAHPLTLVVGPDDVGFERSGEVVDRVRRADVGVIVLEEFGRSGVLAVTVRGPEGDVVGCWQTGWLGKGSLRPWWALRRHSWPRAIQGVGPMRWVSKDAPAWVRTKVG